VYAIADRRASGGEDSASQAARLFRVGIRLLQVRDKEAADSELYASVERVAAEGERVRALVLVNDRVDVALVAGTGVHLGEEDLLRAAARGRRGPGGGIGVSTHDPDAARRAFAEPPVDYVAFGPVFDSPTKPGRRGVGIPELARVAEGKTRPLVAIGGITAET